MIKILNSSENELLKAFDIYNEAFPKSERLPIEILHNRIKEKKEIALGYYTNQSQDIHKFVGFATIFPLKNVEIMEKYDFNVLNYFAIDANFRNKNYGFDFLHQIINTYINENTILIIEIENPYTCEINSSQYKRLLFYRKFNCNEYPDFIYFMPSFSEEKTIEMKLLSVQGNLNNINTTRNIILDKNQLNTLKTAIYEQMYNLSKEDIIRLDL